MEAFLGQKTGCTGRRRADGDATAGPARAMARTRRLEILSAVVLSLTVMITIITIHPVFPPRNASINGFLN